MGCLYCGETVEAGPSIRVQTGGVEHHKRGPVLIQDTYPDGTFTKWAHADCLPDVWTAGLLFQKCVICAQGFDPEDAVLFVEIGWVNGTIGGTTFSGESGGFIHLLCADDLGLELWRQGQEF